MTNIVMWIITAIMILVTPIVANVLISIKNNSKYSFIYDIIETAVKAIEQIGKVNKLTGVEKKKIVIEYVLNRLEAEKITIDSSELDKIIEYTVFNMNLEKEEVNEH